MGQPLVDRPEEHLGSSGNEQQNSSKFEGDDIKSSADGGDTP